MKTEKPNKQKTKKYKRKPKILYGPTFLGSKENKNPIHVILVLHDDKKMFKRWSTFVASREKFRVTSYRRRRVIPAILESRRSFICISLYEEELEL